MEKTKEKDNVISMLSGFTGDISTLLKPTYFFALRQIWAREKR